MKYIDIHCHLDSKDFDSDREEIFVWMKEKETGAITIGTDLESSKIAVNIAESNEDIWACIGVHPGHLEFSKKSESIVSALGHKDKALETILSDFSPADLFSELIKSPKVVGVGECGLEYFHIDKKETEDLQKKLFEEQIIFSLKHNKPLMLHLRPSRGTQDAYIDAIEILKNYPKARGNVHFFAGDISVAQKFLDLGFTMSFTGVITFTNDYNEVIKYIPQNSIMSETDAPWVAPIPWRGKRNEPVYVIEVIKKMAEIRGEDFEILNNALIQNFTRLFL